jgi:hypothetical protein
MSELIPRDQPSPEGQQPTRKPVAGQPPKGHLGWARLAPAFAIAIAADTIAAPAGEWLPIAADLVAGALVALCLGPRPLLLVALIVEAIPGLGLFPTWTAVVGYYAVSSRRAK